MSSSSSSLSSLVSESSLSSFSSLSSESSSQSSLSIDVTNLGISSIDGGSVFNKNNGDKTSYISESSLLQFPSILNNPNFNDSLKWNKVFVIYEHISGQKKVVTHKKIGADWVGRFRVNSYTNSGLWQKSMIIIADKNRAVSVLRRNAIGNEEDVTII